MPYLNLGTVQDHMDPKMDHIPQEDLLVAVEDLECLGHGDAIHDARRQNGGTTDGIGGGGFGGVVLGQADLMLR